MTGAFLGDPAVKAALLERLHAHAANGTLRFGATAWDGRGGSPLGVSTQGGDCVDYAAQFGYPLALAGLLDPMTAQASPDQAVDTTLSWVSCVDVGADLSPIPERIVGHLLSAMDVDRLAAAYHGELFALYRAEASGASPARSIWAELRKRIAQAVEAEAPHSDAHAALTACATACWPLTTSRSILPTLISVWLQDANRSIEAAFDLADRSRAQAMLDAIYQETQSQRDAGQPVDIPALFRARAPLLAASFEAQLARDNARYLDRVRTVPAMVLGHLAATGSDF